MVPNLKLSGVIATSLHGALLGALFLGPPTAKADTAPDPMQAPNLARLTSVEFDTGAPGLLALGAEAPGLLIPSSIDSHPLPAVDTDPAERPGLTLPAVSREAPLESAQPDRVAPSDVATPAQETPSSPTPTTEAPVAGPVLAPGADVAPAIPILLAATSDTAAGSTAETRDGSAQGASYAPRHGAGPGATSGRKASRRDLLGAQSVRTVYEHVDLDMGKPGAADALLYGPGSPGFGKGKESPPSIGGYVHWECPWPAAADRAHVDRAVVHLTADVTVQGRATAVHFIDEDHPGQGFAAEAVRCAYDQHYIPGRTAEGVAVPGRTLKFSVQFNRRGGATASD